MQINGSLRFVGATVPSHAAASLSSLVQEITQMGVPAVMLGDERIWVRASHPLGFDVSLSILNGEYVVFVGGLEQHVDSAQEALEFVALACQPNGRLRIDYLKKRPVFWVLECLGTDDCWRDLAGSGHFIWFRRWRQLRSEYRSNEMN
jgi:hypothetical protein